MWIKQLCNRNVRDFAMAARARKVTGAFEKGPQGPCIREFKKTTTATATGTSWNKRFNEEPMVRTCVIIGHIRILGIGLELACMGGSCGGISLKRDKCHLHLKRLPRISLSFKLVPVQYREYEYGLFLVHFYAVLCKTTTWNDQILRCLKNVNHNG